MRSPFNFIAKPLHGKRYNNTKEIGGVEFVLSSSEEDHKYSNREAEVIEVPIGYDGDVKVGDTLLVHHNVFKFYNDMSGNRRSGKSFFKDDLFFIDTDQFFLFKSDGSWQAHDRFCFVRPIPHETGDLKGSGNEPLTGIMVYPSKMLIEKGVVSGCKVCFTPESEYEFDVDGEKLYRVFDHQITLVL